jgi:uncharacterized Tic20 family protein
MLVHLLSFAGFLFPFFGNILGPLILWLVKRESSTFIDFHGKESVNFQISVTLYGLAATILSFLGIGIPIGIALVVFDVVVVIMAAVKASSGELYRYPLSIRFIG